MSRIRPAALVLLLLATGCSPGAGKPKVKLPHIGETLPFDTASLESGIDDRFGGVGACVIIAETKSGREVYRYNSNSACMNLLPPCQTFEIPAALIALDAGKATPGQVVKWPGDPQPVRAWEKDSDLAGAFRDSIGWWFSSVAASVGAPVFKQRLDGYDYGNKAPEGPVGSFWMGPSQGGRLGVSTRQQAQFLHRLFNRELPVTRNAVDVVEGLMTDESRGAYRMESHTGDCPYAADGAMRASWWVGRLTGPKQDYVFAASSLAKSEDALPGRELRQRGKTVFADAGLWPAQ